jgi:phospholipase C
VNNASKNFTGNIFVSFVNHGDRDETIIIEDMAYKNAPFTISLGSNQNQHSKIINLKNSFNWYDISVKVKGYGSFGKRYAGRVETCNHTKSDPFMGRELG